MIHREPIKCPDCKKPIAECFCQTPLPLPIIPRPLLPDALSNAIAYDVLRDQLEHALRALSTQIKINDQMIQRLDKLEEQVKELQRVQVS